MKVSSLIFSYFSILTLVTAQSSSLQCGQVSHSKRILLANPGSIPDTCQYKIGAYSPYTCQLLIQFERFLLHQPTLRSDHLECRDRLTVGNFVLCGDNAQQHLYIPIDAAAYTGKKGSVLLNFQLPSRWSQTRWNIVVTQLECPHTTNTFRLSSIPGLGFLQGIANATRTFFPPPSLGDLDMIAPRGCDQYYTQRTGTIRSFNFNATNGNLYMANTSYVICVKAAEDVQKIEYTVQKFSMSIEPNLKIGLDNDCHNYVLTDGRRADFLMIPQSTLPNFQYLRPTYYCGQSLENHQVIASLPFLIYFQSDSQSDPTETGFNISYRVK